MAAKRRFFTQAEFAELTGVSLRTIQRRVRTGDIRAVRVSYHTVRIPAAELKRLPSAAAAAA